MNYMDEALAKPTRCKESRTRTGGRDGNGDDPEASMGIEAPASPPEPLSGTGDGAASSALSDSFAGLYERTMPRIYGYLRTRTGSEEDAVDLTQQVFLRALDALPGYRDRGVPVEVWLFRIARNLAVDAHRQRRQWGGQSASGTVSWDLLPPTLHPAASLEEEPEAAALRREAHARLNTLLLRLDPEQRELLALRFAARLTAREIGSVVGKSEEAVQKQLTRLLHTLREQYDEEDDE